MLRALGPYVAALALVLGAREVAGRANTARATWTDEVEAPYAPSADAAPVVSLGYRELMADWMWIRALGYFGGGDTTSSGVRHLIEAIAALDPGFEAPMTWGATAMQSFTMKLTNEDYLAVLRVIEAAMERFPREYRLPQRAGEIYALRLRSDDPAQQRAWKARGAALLARSVRLPGSPGDLGTYVAHLESQLGQHDKAVRDLRELIYYTTNADTKRRLTAKLAKLTQGNADALAYELDVENQRFFAAWQHDSPELPPAAYVVIGGRLSTWFDPADLGGSDDRPLAPIEPLPVLSDDIGEAPSPPASPE